MKACTVAGPKPTRFKFGYKEDNSLCKKIKKAMLRQFRRLYSRKGVLYWRRSWGQFMGR